MIKHINHQNFSTTPFVAAKAWDLYNVQNDELVLLEQSGSGGTELDVALDYIDYSIGLPLLNRACNIALEQQDANILGYQEGITGSGAFDADNDERNTDGTYKRLVHDQTYRAFYNSYRNPTQIFGVEYVDFPLSRTKRYLSEYFRMFTIPRIIFGEKIQPYSVRFQDTNLDDNVIVYDDGFQNLNAGYDLFSKVQEVKMYVSPTGSNVILTGSISTSCIVYDDTVVSASAGDTMSFAMGYELGYTQEEKRLDTSSMDMGFFSGSLSSRVESDSAGMGAGYVYGSLDYRIESDAMFFGGATSHGVAFDHGHLFETITPLPPLGDSGSIGVAIYSGSIFDTIVYAPPVGDSGSVGVAIYSGSLFNEAILAYDYDHTASIFMGYDNGYIADVAMTTPLRNAYQTMSIGFLNGTRSIVSGGTGYATSSNGTIVPE